MVVNPLGAAVLVLALSAATAFGIWRARTDGRLRSNRSTALPGSASGSAQPDDGATTFSPTDLGAPLGERATLVQFSTVFCQPCRATRRILDEVVGMVDGVRYVDIDAEDHLSLVRRLDIRRTPTIFVLDDSGRVVKRATGQPRKADVVAALGEVL
jgi:thiol-disulfide isomerase/thioredoxin